MQQQEIISLSGDNIIEYVRDYRNELIAKLLNDETLSRYLSDNHNLNDVSAIKLEFIKRALKELVSSPLDLSHYGQIILDMRKKGSIVVSTVNEKLFYLDVEKSIGNYLL